MKNLALTLVAIGALTNPHIASAGNTLPAADAPVSADVVYIAGIVSFVTQVTEPMLRQIGCTYAVDDAATAAQLLELLNAAREIPQNTADLRQTFDIRNKVTIHFRDKKDQSVVIGARFSNGTYMTATWNGEPVLLRNDVMEKIKGVVQRGGYAQRNPKPSPECTEP